MKKNHIKCHPFFTHQFVKLNTDEEYSFTHQINLTLVNSTKSGADKSGRR